MSTELVMPSNTLLDLAAQLNIKQIDHLFIDEIHKYTRLGNVSRCRVSGFQDAGVGRMATNEGTQSSEQIIEGGEAETHFQPPELPF